MACTVLRRLLRLASVAFRQALLCWWDARSLFRLSVDSYHANHMPTPMHTPMPTSMPTYEIYARYAISCEGPLASAELALVGGMNVFERQCKVHLNARQPCSDGDGGPHAAATLQHHIAMAC